MDISTESAIEVIRNYEEYLEFIGEWQGYSFKQLSFSKWAVKEILKCLKEQVSEPPLSVIENFIDKMESYSCLNSKNGFIFSIACDVAENIIDELISS